MTKIKPKIIAIVGPTGSGKSDLALRLAKLAQSKSFKKYGIHGAEIISADSRQVYRGMDIGTGKVKRDKTLPANLKFKILNLKFLKNHYYSSGVRHHLIDVSSPKKIFTVAEFKKRGEKTIKDISNKNKIPIIVGGTGQYIDTLIYNLSLPQVPPNHKLRAKLEKQTTEQLFAKLKELDIDRSQTIDSKNKVRLIRALEIIITTGKPVPFFNTKSYVLSPKSYNVLWLGLNPENLQKRISTRLSARFRQGMIAEVKKLHSQGISLQRFYDLGLEYRWIGQYLQNKLTKDKMVFSLEQAIRQYSKRQMTWFKRNKNIHWIKSLEEAKKLMKAFV